MTDIIICLIVAALMAMAVFHIVRVRRAAKACGDRCAGCSMSGSCHAVKMQKELKRMEKMKKAGAK